jgi:serine/threonine protein kinase
MDYDLKSPRTGSSRLRLSPLDDPVAGRQGDLVLSSTQTPRIQRPSIVSQHSNSVPWTPLQVARKYTTRSRSPSPNGGLGSHSPRSVSSEANGTRDPFLSSRSSPTTLVVPRLNSGDTTPLQEPIPNYAFNPNHTYEIGYNSEPFEPDYIYDANVATHIRHEDTGEEDDISMKDTASSESNTSSIEGDDSDEAIAAWNRRFGARRQVEFTRNDKEPFMAGRRLGGGGVGIVHETYLDGIPLALKRTYTRRLSPHELNEIKILGRMSEKRHRHIVELVGSYIHQQKGGYELGLLIWPVAHADLATVLHDLGFLAQCLLSDPPPSRAELDTAVEPLLFLAPPNLKASSTWGPPYVFFVDPVNWQEHIRRSIGCIAEAVAYLHKEGIRHKDLKPSQILLSPEGLWLTDFGWSTDISEFSHSTTSGGDNITAKYHAPERAKKQPCGRAEDVFALGCIFLEMSYAILPAAKTSNIPRPWSRKGWSFQENLEHCRTWLEPLYTSTGDPAMQQLGEMIASMLTSEAQDRPYMWQVVSQLRNDDGETSRFISACCHYDPVLAAFHDPK